MILRISLLFLITISASLAFSQKTIRSLEPINWKKVAICEKAVEKNPDSLSLHEQYIKSIGWTGDLYWKSDIYPTRFDSVVFIMEEQYKKWALKLPKSYVIPLAIGSAFWEGESPKASEYLKKAIQLNPKLADGYFKLSIDAERWGNEELAKTYMKAATEANPLDPSYAFYYAMYFDKIDMDVFRSKIYDLVKKFPTHERAAQGLYWLGANTRNVQEKIKIYEELQVKFPPLKSSWSASGMYALFGYYIINNQFTEAIKLAQDMQQKQGWTDQLRFAKGYSVVNQLIKKGDYSTANDSIQALKKIRTRIPGSSIVLLEADVADKTGNAATAYETLVKIQAKEPTDELQTAIKTYALKLGKSDSEISKDIWILRNQNTKPATPFELGLYTSDKNAKLSDYQGKVILLTFWFPGCGPCRGEFPNFEHVVRKFKSSELAYLGINVSPVQDQYVVPFMKGTNYSFTPLKATSEWAAQAYGVRGEPTNFLIDKKGNIVYSYFRTDDENERTLELMIQSLLEKP